jgi:hypothetical protein
VISVVGWVEGRNPTRLSVTDANSHTTTYQYDAANQLVNVDEIEYTIVPHYDTLDEIFDLD